MATAAADAIPSQELREILGCIGRRGEIMMMTATSGSNAHRGAIWSLGLLVSACSALGRGASEAAITATAARIARFQDHHAPPQRRPGAEACVRYQVRGAVGEAVCGFPHVISIGLPALRSARQARISETHARLDALLAIMSSLVDTCLLWRGGWHALELAQTGARRVLQLGGSGSPAGAAALAQLESSLLAVNASPGGSADLLAACLFLDELCRIGGEAA
jgi:triphosphoribosyl-dephospho-CoA synthase